MEFKIRTHSVTDNGYEIYKVGSHVPQDLMGYYSEIHKAQAAIDAYMLKVIEKKEKLEKEIEEEKAKAEETKAKAKTKKTTKAKTTKK